jgi:hypothetical protein
MTRPASACARFVRAAVVRMRHAAPFVVFACSRYALTMPSLES